MNLKSAVSRLVLAGLIIAGIFRSPGGDCAAAIIYPKAPEGGREMVRKEVGEIQKTDRMLGDMRMEDLTTAQPYREYYVGLTNLAAGNLLSAATSRSWRYIILHDTNAVGVATVIADDRKTKPSLQFNGLFKTGFSTETLEALRQVEKLPQVKQQNYELRFLEVPAVYFVALWLHGKSDDIIVPLPPTFGRMDAFQTYSESQIIKLLKPAATEVLKQPKLFRGKPCGGAS